MNWPDWLKVIQLKPRFLFGIWGLGALLLFLPDKTISVFGAVALRDSYRPWIGVTTLAAFVFWVVQLVPHMHQYISRWKQRREVIRSLESLSEEEWLILAYCMERNQRTITLTLADRVAGSLMAKGLLVMASGLGNQLAWPNTIPTHLWKHLSKDKEAFMGRWKFEAEFLQYRFSEIDAHVRRYDDF